MGKGNRTNRDHALPVVVEILLDDLQQRLDRPPGVVLITTTTTTNATNTAATINILAQIPALLLHLGERDSQPAHDALVGHLVDIALDDQAEVEDELVAVVARARDGHGEAQHKVLAFRVGHGDVAVAEGLARDDVLLQHAEVEQRRLGGAVGAAGAGPGNGNGHDAARWALCYDFGPCCWGWVVSSLVLSLGEDLCMKEANLLWGRSGRRISLESW
jgi:hypothetical protein